MEQTALYGALPAEKREPADMYDAALAHLSEGFSSSSPALVQAALKLLQQLDRLAVRSMTPYTPVTMEEVCPVESPYLVSLICFCCDSHTESNKFLGAVVCEDRKST